MEEMDYGQSRRNLTGRDGTKVVDFLGTLKPRYGIVYRDIAFGYLALAVSAAVTAFLPSLGVSPLLSSLIGAVLIGYWIAYLLLFLHAGAHHNLASSGKSSDRLCDLLISWIVGTSVKQYRIVHFKHHSAHGTVNDSEHTYFYPLDLAFLLKSLTGIRSLEILLFRKKLSETQKIKSPAANKAFPFMLLAGLAVHFLIISLCLMAGFWWLALAWILGVGLMFPFFGALRQLLEHRKPDADDTVDYTKIDHGRYTRLFGGGPLASTFGGAGFNRHLIHHWEPQISYTNLAEFEKFLASTEVKNAMDENRSTYLKALSQLFHTR